MISFCQLAPLNKSVDIFLLRNADIAIGQETLLLLVVIDIFNINVVIAKFPD